MKKNKISFTVVLIAIFVSFGLCSNAVVKFMPKSAQSIQKVQPTKQATVQPTKEKNNVYEQVNAVEVVANPKKYLNQHITIKGTFDKFSILGLDYKPAFRSSEKYITFLIKRDNSVNKLVPLSEMKIFMQRDDAEKYVDLTSGDVIEFNGFVFSNALGDVWIEVDKFTVINQKQKEVKPVK